MENFESMLTVSNILAYGGGLFVIGLFGLALIIMMVLRRVVPTNMVHIVQSSKATTPYGKGKDSGNTYYEIPTWVPYFGVSVIEFPESIFKVPLLDYEAYDSARLPFMVDVTAFFRVEKSDVAAHRVEDFEELCEQLEDVLKGSVRRILATNQLENIMEARASLGEEFTKEVDKQIEEWGVTTVKTIEFMDLRDNLKANSKVIANIMAKEQSRIDKESRIQVADNRKAAELAEIDANRTVEVQQQDALQQVGLRTAQKDQAVGIAQEQSQQNIQEEAAITAAKNMEVKRIEAERAAEIARSVNVTNATAAQQVKVIGAEADKTAQIAAAGADKESVTLRSEGDLVQAENDAKAIRFRGESTAEAERLLLLAPVTAQVTLAKEIGENPGYQSYLIEVRKIEASQDVGRSMAEAIKEADLKVFSNGGSQGEILGGVANIADVFTSKGGTSIAGMLSALAQTPEGKAVIAKVTGDKASS